MLVVRIMNNKEFELIPPAIAAKSISQREIVLPLQEALKVIDIFESKGIHILGWEGWIRHADGHVGHSSTIQGTVSLEKLTVEEAAEFCRKTMLAYAAIWEKENMGSNEKLYFCITVST